MAGEPLRIVRLEAQNIKRLKAVAITPAGHVVVIGGNNAQGKTSVLDSIAMALGGLDQAPAVPIRHGASKAQIVLDLGDLVVKRTFTGKGSSLVVEDANGAPMRSPQAILDSLVGRLTFDPLAFTRMEPKKQLETLRAVTGLDFQDLDISRAHTYAERTKASAALKALESQLAAMPKHEGVPAEPMPVVHRTAPQLQGFEDLAPKRAAIVAKVRENDAKKAKAREAATQAAGFIQSHADSVEEVSRLKAKLNQAIEEEAISRKLAEKAQRTRDELYREVESLVDPSLDEIDAEQSRREAANAEAIRAEQVEAQRLEDERQVINAKVEANKRRAQVEFEAARARDKVAGMTAEIERVDREKAEALVAARFPVEGLGFGADGVLYNDLPFEQASAAEQLRVSVAMGLALNPRLRVMLVRDGSLLDENSLALLGRLAEEHGAQVWMEVVGKGGKCSVVIEDGQVEGATVPGAAEAETAGANA